MRKVLAAISAHIDMFLEAAIAYGYGVAILIRYIGKPLSDSILTHLTEVHTIPTIVVPIDVVSVFR